MRASHAAFTLIITAALAGCRDAQSVMAPQSEDAARYALLGWILFGGGTAILVGVTVLSGLSIWGGREVRARLSSESFVFGGGLVFPGVILVLLLVYSVVLMGAGAAPSAPSSRSPIAQDDVPVAIEVVGEQWWWRVTYNLPDGRSITTANELRIPVGRRVRLTLKTADVIHSFWVPRLAGKIDMIPGRANVLTIAAAKPGVARGQCAEYCGGAHARMSLHVVSLDPDAYAEWVAGQSRSADEPRTDVARRGQTLFLSTGCGGCHRIAGTLASGTIGPDLTHVGSRIAIAAATLPNDVASLARWIRHNQRIKPGNRMLAYEFLDDDALTAMATYLVGLK